MSQSTTTDLSQSTDVQCRMKFDSTFRVGGTLTRVRVDTYSLNPNDAHQALAKVVDRALECQDESSSA